MMRHSFALRSVSLGHSIDQLEEGILSHVEEELAISCDTLVMLLSEYSWSQIFSAVDRLARDKRVTLCQHRYGYSLFSAGYAA